MGRTQKGNNNACCQDNDISWYDWGAVDDGLFDFTARLIELRRKHPVLRRRRWFQGKAIHGTGVHDIGWFTPEGKEMEEEHWGEGFAKSMAVFLNGEAIPGPNARGERIVDDSFYLLFNGHHESIAFKLPEAKWGQKWTKVFSTHELKFAEEEQSFAAGDGVAVEARSLMVLLMGGGPGSSTG